MAFAIFAETKKSELRVHWMLPTDSETLIAKEILIHCSVKKLVF